MPGEGVLYGSLKDEALQFFGNDPKAAINSSTIARNEIGVYLAMEKALPENLKNLAAQGHPARVLAALWRRIEAIKAAFSSNKKTWDDFVHHISGEFDTPAKIHTAPSKFNESAYPRLTKGGHLGENPGALPENISTWIDHLFKGSKYKSGYKNYKVDANGEELPVFLARHFNVPLSDLLARCDGSLGPGCWYALVDLARANFKVHANGSITIGLPQILFTNKAWDDTVVFAKSDVPRKYWQFDGYQAGVKTIFPYTWSAERIALAADYIKRNGDLVSGDVNLGTRLGFYPPGDPNGIWMAVSFGWGRTNTAFPTPNQIRP
jgi:hypothetical protein